MVIPGARRHPANCDGAGDVGKALRPVGGGPMRVATDVVAFETGQVRSGDEVSNVCTQRGFVTMQRSAIAGLVLVVAAMACADTTSPREDPSDEITQLPRALTTTEHDIVDATGAFTFDLLREVNRDWKDGNVFLSPLSASMALGMTMNGAAGTTLDQMRQALGFGAQSLSDINTAYQGLIALLRGLDPKVRFELANAIWYDTRFGPFIAAGFLADVRQWFDAEAGPLAFGTPESVSTINAWASQHTDGRIDHVIDDTGGDLVMILANAIYFKGDWRDPFDADLTAPAPFTTLAGETVDVPTMHRDSWLRLGSMPGARVVEIPYGGNAYAMTLLLPDAGTNINDFVDALTPVAWNTAVAGLTDRELEIRMPRFTLAWKDTLQSPLKRMGMQVPFVGGAADFTRLSPARGHDLYISFVKQDTYVDVNEEGTEAAAVTTVGIGEVSLPLPVVVDRPFVFAIRERLSGTILFIGKIVDPR